MKYMLSKKEINSYEGDIVTLVLSGDADISDKDIRWSVQGECISIRTFEGDNLGFTNGVLITLLREGGAQVCAELDGEKHFCGVSVRKRKQADPNGKFNFYVGDFHDHTTLEHDHEEFAKLDLQFISDYVKQISNEGRMDVMVISDHSDSSNKAAFFKGFVEEERQRKPDIVIFPGAESEVTKIERDRLNLGHKNSGEIVTLNCDNFSCVKTWEEFYDDMSTSPFGVCILAHPQVVGWDENGIWNFSLDKNNTAQMKKLVKFVEIGNGIRGYSSNIINEYIYSVALDNGFFVSTTSSSDCHGPKWGYDTFPGKTIVMAPEKSREMFLDALLNRRAYACESGNVKLLIKVNGKTVPCTVQDAREYDFHVDISYFRDDAASVPVKCEVISNYGEVIRRIENVDFSSFDFKVESDDAVYFYLRFVDKNGRRTFSPPVLTGRELPKTEISEFKAISKENFTAFNALDGSDARVLLNDNPAIPWYSAEKNASVIIDMGQIRKISAFGHYPHRFLQEKLQENNMKAVDMLKSFPHEYKISVSADGEKYREVATGRARVFGAEEIKSFPETEARYVKFDVTETVGHNSGLEEYTDAPVCLGELTVFERI